MRILLIAFVVVNLTSCSGIRSLRFTTYDTVYLLSLPKGFELKKLKDDEGYSEYQAAYTDGPIVYITDDNKSGGSIDVPKRSKYGDDVYIRVLANDTLILSGVDTNGYFWKEVKNRNVVIGYVNVPSNKKEEFDKALDSLRIR